MIAFAPINRTADQTPILPGKARTEIRQAGQKLKSPKTLNDRLPYWTAAGPCYKGDCPAL
jgi:hypothetical protein